MSYLSIIGAVYILYLLYRFVSFIFLYFLSSYPLDDFLTGASPYAIVTGASDGIGKGIAKELYKRGFNLILHGRNEEKMKKVVEEIGALRNGREERDIRMFLADAAKGDHDFQSIVDPFRNLNISILVNNVGGASDVLKVDEWSMDGIVETMNMNMLFGTGLIHELLPQFRNRRGKCLVVSVGSIVTESCSPRLALYAACKGFLKTFTKSLAIDERQFIRTNVEFLYLNVSQVSTNALRRPPALSRPDADTFGKAAVDKFACGRWEVTPYIMHAVQAWFISIAGEYLVERMGAQEMKKILVEVEEMKKTR